MGDGTEILGSGGVGAASTEEPGWREWGGARRPPAASRTCPHPPVLAQEVLGVWGPLSVPDQVRLQPPWLLAVFDLGQVTPVLEISPTLR